MVDEGSIESIWVIAHHFESRLDLILDFVIVGYIVDRDFAFFDQGEFESSVQIIDQLID
jgi:hypothetical protein